MNQEQLAPPVEQPILVDSTAEHNELHIPHAYGFMEWFFHYWHRIALILLIIHGLIGLFESVRFIAFEFRTLSEELEQHIISEHQVNELLAAAIVTFLATLVNIFFAIRLSRVSQTTAHNIDLIVATALIITTRHAQAYLISLDLLTVFVSSVPQLL